MSATTKRKFDGQGMAAYELELRKRWESGELSDEEVEMLLIMLYLADEDGVVVLDEEDV